MAEWNKYQHKMEEEHLQQLEEQMVEDRAFSGCSRSQVTPTPHTSPRNAPGLKAKEKSGRMDSTTGNLSARFARKLLWPQSEQSSVPIMQSFPEVNWPLNTSGKMTQQLKEQGNIKFTL